MIEWAVITLGAANTVVLIYVLRNQASERRDTLDRLMSRNLVEYKELTDPIPEPSGPVSLTDEEEWMKEIEMMKTGQRT